jgi:hypothetical protein
VENYAFSILQIVANNLKANSLSLKSNDAIWGKPSEGFVKLNVDASFHENNRSG